MNAPCIDKASPADIPRLVELLTASDEAGVNFKRAELFEGIRFLIEHPQRGQIYVVRKEGRVIAMASVLTTISTAEGGFVLVVEEFVVDEDYRNQGIGSLLLEYTVGDAQGNGFLRITLASEKLTEAARQFFRRRGFVDSEMIPMRLLLAEPKLA